MKAKNLFLSFFAVLLLCCGNTVLADDTGTGADQVSVEVTVNINEADAETLASTLNGIGLSKANAIVAYREANGPFYSAEELSAVRGIGMTTIEKNAGRIIVD
jgi:competence protein ComEA